MHPADVDAELARLQRAATRASANIVELDSSSTVTLLDAAELAGETADAWAGARADLDRLYVDAASLASALESAATMRLGFMTPQRYRRLEAMLLGPTVVVADAAVGAADRGLLDGSRRVETCTPGEMLERMVHRFDEIRGVVAEVRRRWDEYPALVGAMRQQLADLVRRSADLGADAPPDASVVATRIDRIADAVLTDPLSISVDDLGRVAAEVATISGHVDEVDQVRTDGGRRVDAARELARRVAVAMADVDRSYQWARERFVDAQVPVPPSEPALDEMLREIESIARDEQWTLLVGALGDFDRRAASVLAEVERVTDELGALVERRRRLRGRLDAYVAKASAAGVIELPELVVLTSQAQGELRRGPTDLERVDELMEQISAVILGGASARTSP
jgi:hypothetical protein